MRGDGGIYKRGDVYWIHYSRDGQRFRESARTTDPDVARQVLQRARKAIERGELLSVRQRRVTISEILDDLLTHLRLRQRAYAAKAPYHLKALRALLGDKRAASLETAIVERYQQARADEGLAPATINRECELLRQAYRLAARRQPPKVGVVPYIPLLPVENARQGFLSRADFSALIRAMLDPDVRDFIEWFWWTGMRPKEIRQLSWEMLDRETKTLNLEARITKTRLPRSIVVAGPLEAVMKRRLERRRMDSPLIFHRRGRPVTEDAVRASWRAAVKAARLPAGLRPYDLRRSAIRNMLRAGVHERVVMSISGHRTRSTFDRYNITSGEDIKRAIEVTGEYVKTLPAKRRVSDFRKR